MDLLSERYDLSNRPLQGVTMSLGKPIQEGVRVELPKGVGTSLQPPAPKTFAAKTDSPRVSSLSPTRFMQKVLIDEIKKQEGRDLTRFDVDLDLPDEFLPEFPAPIYLTTRPDLGDASQGKLVTIDNYYQLFNGILNPKQLEGLRILLTLSPQQ